jgi:MATE family, multidrug efflux pump
LSVRIFRVGLPAGGISTVESGLFVAVQLLIGTLGIVALAANQIAFTAGGIIFMIPLALSQAAAARVGYNLGAGNIVAARQSGFVALAITAVYMAAMATFMWTCSEAIVSIFLDDADPTAATVLPLAAALIAIAAVFQIVDGTQIVAMGALRGLSDTVVPFLLGLLGYWAIGLTSGYIFAFVFGHGAVGLWWGLALGLAASATLLTWRFHARTRALALTQ